MIGRTRNRAEILVPVAHPDKTSGHNLAQTSCASGFVSYPPK